MKSLSYSTPVDGGNLRKAGCARLQDWQGHRDQGRLWLINGITYNSFMTREHNHPEDPRRRLLLQALAAGVLGIGFIRSSQAETSSHANPLPLDKSIYKLTGSLNVNGIAATAETRIYANDILETGVGSHVVFVSGHDAFILRESSRLELTGKDFVVSGLRLVTGAMLSVFGKGQHHLETPTATIGIRGTGIYVEAMPDRSYCCTCYGTTETASSDIPSQVETITSTHHAARYVLANCEHRIINAPFMNHTDMELMLIEALVGRVPPFAVPD